MFTGIVSAVGRIDRVVRTTENGKRTTPGLALTIRAPFKGIRKGESIAVNGVCLTVERAVKGRFSVHVVATTEGRTLFGEYAWVYDLRVPEAVREVSILPGAITVDGVSLTINDLPGKDSVQIALIPFTREHTTLGALGVGDRVHVEGDVLGKYVRQLCSTAK